MKEKKSKWFLSQGLCPCILTQERSGVFKQLTYKGGFIVFVDAYLATGAVSKSEATLLLCNVDVNN